MQKGYAYLFGRQRHMRKGKMRNDQAYERKHTCMDTNTHTHTAPSFCTSLSSGELRLDRTDEDKVMVNPVMQLWFTSSMRVQPTFHVFNGRLMLESSLSRSTEDPTPVRIGEGAPAYTVWKILDIYRGGKSFPIVPS